MEDGLLYCLSLSLKFTIITRPPVLFALFRYDAPIGPLAGSFHTSAQTMVPQSGVRVLERPRRQHLRPYWNAGRLQRLNNSDRQGVLAGCRSPLALASLSTSARLGGLFLAADAGRAHGLTSEWRSLGRAWGAVFPLALD